MSKIEKDFYDRLPSMVCELLDRFIPKYEKEDWFLKAWNEYREYILNEKDVTKMRMPGYIFKKYIK